jgi:hypothetical protein
MLCRCQPKCGLSCVPCMPRAPAQPATYICHAHPYHGKGRSKRDHGCSNICDGVQHPRTIALPFIKHVPCQQGNHPQPPWQPSSRTTCNKPQVKAARNTRYPQKARTTPAKAQPALPAPACMCCVSIPIMQQQPWRSAAALSVPYKPAGRLEQLHAKQAPLPPHMLKCTHMRTHHTQPEAINKPLHAASARDTSWV